MKARIEETLSKILSEKYDAKITIKFEKKEQDNNGNTNTTGAIYKK